MGLWACGTRRRCSLPHSRPSRALWLHLWFSPPYILSLPSHFPVVFLLLTPSPLCPPKLGLHIWRPLPPPPPPCSTLPERAVAGFLGRFHVFQNFSSTAAAAATEEAEGRALRFPDPTDGMGLWMSLLRMRKGLTPAGATERRLQAHQTSGVFHPCIEPPGPLSQDVVEE